MEILHFSECFLREYATTVGKTESVGPLGDLFDECETDEYFAQKSFEQAESEMASRNLTRLLRKADCTEDSLDVILGGDLNDQCTATSFAVTERSVPFLGLYGACSTIAEALLLGSVLIDGKKASDAVAMASSHFCTAERQFRFPTEYGSQKPPYAQRTVTGAGAYLLSGQKSDLRISMGVIGRVIDYGLTDANNMGACMAPAAADTLLRFAKEEPVVFSKLDRIVTGDLGEFGSELFYELCEREGVGVRSLHCDCGKMIYDPKKQDVHSGGSGCGCMATVLGAYFLKKMREKAYHGILAIGTGALLSPKSVLQKKSIPSVAHAVVLETEEKT